MNDHPYARGARAKVPRLSMAECLLYNASGCWLSASDANSYRAHLFRRGPFDHLQKTMDRSKESPFCPSWCEAIESCCSISPGAENTMVRLSVQDTAALGLVPNGGVLRTSRRLK